jgi:hypothetical protein
MFQCSYTIIREGINSCLLKLYLLKQSIKIYRFVVNTVVVWLHILGPYWCMYVALFGSRQQCKLECEAITSYCSQARMFRRFDSAVVADSGLVGCNVV